MHRSATLIVDMKAAMRFITMADEAEEEEVEEVEDVEAEHKHQPPMAGEADNHQTATTRLELAPPVIARSEMPQKQQRAKAKTSN